ncbi:MAG TPA: hypothetical protein DCM86_04575, partial [Verrucomicrobiales bacterium]|nr:hypothetical protein [Verrucomicrobiales bacterium]
TTQPPAAPPPTSPSFPAIGLEPARSLRPASPASPPPPTPAPSTPATPTARGAAAAPSPDAGFQLLGFDKLAGFSFEVSDEILQASPTNATQVAARTLEQIPQTVREFDLKRVSLKGFMLPLKVEGGKVTEMLIMRDQSMCCYGAVPKINEWVSVRMVGGGVKPIMDQAITMYGKLHVGEMRENGYLVGIYHMDGERIDGPAEN